MKLDRVSSACGSPKLELAGRPRQSVRLDHLLHLGRKRLTRVDRANLRGRVPDSRLSAAWHRNDQDVSGASDLPSLDLVGRRVHDRGAVLEGDLQRRVAARPRSHDAHLALDKLPHQILADTRSGDPCLSGRVSIAQDQPVIATYFAAHEAGDRQNEPAVDFPHDEVGHGRFFRSLSSCFQVRVLATSAFVSQPRRACATASST